jgi:hypothetical protein
MIVGGALVLTGVYVGALREVEAAPATRAAAAARGGG